MRNFNEVDTHTVQAGGRQFTVVRDWRSGVRRVRVFHRGILLTKEAAAAYGVVVRR